MENWRMRVPRTVVGAEEQEVCNLDPKNPVLKEQLETVDLWKAWEECNKESVRGSAHCQNVSEFKQDNP